MLDLNKIIQHKLKDDQYYQEEFKKTQIYIHHTAGGSNPFSVISGWDNTSVRIGTCTVIAGTPSKKTNYVDGDIVQAFSSRYWAYHLGLKNSMFKKFNLSYLPLDKTSIGIEVCNWGYVTETENGWETYVGTTIPETEVVEYSVPFKGRHHYHRYTDAQIESLYDLLVYFGEKYDIPTKNDGEELFDINIDAFNGIPGIYTHVSVREDKSDMHPQKELIEMLNSL